MSGLAPRQRPRSASAPTSRVASHEARLASPPVVTLPQQGCCVTGCKRVCFALVVLVYFCVPAIPVIELLRDALDPEDRLAESLVTYLRKTSNESDIVSVSPAASERVLIGDQLSSAGLRKKHPVIFIPGIISTGLELWQGKRCARRHFRRRLWGDLPQANKMLLDVPCWLDHMRLDNKTGLDPEGIKLRAASGLNSADVMLNLYSLWGIMVQQLAPLGYDESSVYLASYDWRLRFDNMERRDAYFTTLKRTVEQMSDMADHQRAVIVTHSMGYNVFVYFMQWVHSRAATGSQCPYLPAADQIRRQQLWPQEDEDGALPEACDGWWAKKYLKTWINLAGPGAGTPKGLPAWYNGQMTNNAGLGPILGSIVENRLPKRSLRELWRSFHSMTSLQPMGGSRLWGGRVGAGGTRAPWSGWRSTSEKAKGALVSPASEAALFASRTLHPPSNQRRFAAPDELLSTGPVGRGMFSLRRFVSWESLDPAALAARLLGPIGNYMPAVWAAREVGSDEAVEVGAVGEQVELPIARPGSTSQPIHTVQQLPDDGDSDTLASALVRLLTQAGFAQGTGQTAASPPSSAVTSPQSSSITSSMDSITSNESLHQALKRAGFADEDGDGAVTADDAFIGLHRGKYTSSSLSHHTPNLPIVNDDKTCADSNSDGIDTTHGQEAEADNDDNDEEEAFAPAAHDTHMSAEQVMDLIRLQSPEFASLIDGFVDLNAWRPPTEAELDSHPEAAGVFGNRSRYRVVAGGLPRRFWSNPLSTPLPNAPEASIICFYGIGRQTERHYNMIAARAASSAPWELVHDSLAAGNDSLDATQMPVPVEIASSFHASPEVYGQTSVDVQTRVHAQMGPRVARAAPGRVVSGTTFADGDGTVPTLSLALPCSRHYRSKEGNPGGMRVVTRELPYTEADGIEQALLNIPATWHRSMSGKTKTGPDVASTASSDPAEAVKTSQDADDPFGIDWLLHVSQSGLVKGTLDFIRAGGGQTSEHVDILLNAQVITTTIAEASGQKGAAVADSISATSLALLERLDESLDGLTPLDSTN